MQIDIDTLPTEVESLREIIGVINNKNYLLLDECNKLLNENSKLLNENTELLDRINILKEQLAVLKAKKFGKSSEKLDRQIDL